MRGIRSFWRVGLVGIHNGGFTAVTEDGGRFGVFLQHAFGVCEEWGFGREVRGRCSDVERGGYLSRRGLVFASEEDGSGLCVW